MKKSAKQFAMNSYGIIYNPKITHVIMSTSSIEMDKYVIKNIVTDLKTYQSGKSVSPQLLMFSSFS